MWPSRSLSGRKTAASSCAPTACKAATPPASPGLRFCPLSTPLSRSTTNTSFARRVSHVKPCPMYCISSSRGRLEISSAPISAGSSRPTWRDPRNSATPRKASPTQSPCRGVMNRRSGAATATTASNPHPITKYGNCWNRTEIDDSMKLLTSSLQEQRDISSSAVDVLPRLQQHRQSLRDDIGSQFVSSQQPQRIDPVERLADRRRLGHTQPPDCGGEACHLQAEPGISLARARNDLDLQFRRRVIHPQQETPAAECVCQLPLSV